MVCPRRFFETRTAPRLSLFLHDDKVVAIVKRTLYDYDTILRLSEIRCTIFLNCVDNEVQLMADATHLFIETFRAIGL